LTRHPTPFRLERILGLRFLRVVQPPKASLVPARLRVGSRLFSLSIAVAGLAVPMAIAAAHDIVGSVSVPPRAMGDPLTGSATFRFHVGAIVGWRAEEQVIGANARRIVAAVTNKHSAANRAVHGCPDKAVGVDAVLALRRTWVESAVAGLTITHGRPFPAGRTEDWVNRTVLGDLRPEPIQRTFRRLHSKCKYNGLPGCHEDTQADGNKEVE
jgi:hypothetical protein